MQNLESLIEELRENAKLAEQERAKADALFVSIGDGAIATNEQGKISRVNQVALDILGFEEAELLNAWYPSAILAVDEEGDRIPILQRPITQAFITGQPISAKSFYKKKDGSTVAVAMTVSPVILDGKPVGAIEVFRDNSKEFEVDRMKSEFISLASHQLRTPLTAIKLDAYMLKEGFVGDLTSEQQKQVRMILFSIDRMEELISALLNITRIEAGRIAVTPRTTRLETLMRSIVKELDSAAREKKIKVKIDIKDKLPTLITDKLLVKETCANLLSNAIKYSPPESLINVSLYEDGDDLVFCVKDKGYGIPQNEQNRVFSKFYRGSNIKQKEAIGTGLGLYMIKGVVDNLAGKIWFDSQEGKGTAFYVSLPKYGPTEKQGSTTIEPTIVKLK